MKLLIGKIKQLECDITRAFTRIAAKDAAPCEASRYVSLEDAVYLTRTKYYWLILGGLLFGLILIFPIVLFEEEIKENNVLIALFLLSYLFPGMCHLTVLIFVWEQFKTRLLIAFGIAVLIAILANPVSILIFSLGLWLGPFIFWIFQYRFYVGNAHDT